MGANAAVCLTGAAELGVDVAGPSLHVCPHAATMVVWFWSGFKFSQNLYLHGAGCTMVSTQVVLTPR